MIAIKYDLQSLLKITMSWDCRDGSAAKGTQCSYRGSELCSQHPYQAAQGPSTPLWPNGAHQPHRVNKYKMNLLDNNVLIMTS